MRNDKQMFKTSADAIEQQAAEWIVHGAESGSLQERARLEAWLREDPRHRAAYVRLETVWGKTGRLRNLRSLSAGIDKDLLRDPARSAHSRRVLPWAVGLAAALALCVFGVAMWLSLAQPQWQIHSTERDGFARVTLKDGSTLDLNGDSQVRVRLNDTRREIVLERGEAHFVVAHDARRVFTVAAGDRIVRALGTAFSVRLRAAQPMEVLVTEGRVAILAEQEMAEAERRNENLRANDKTGALNRQVVSGGEAAVVSADAVVVRQVDAAEISQRLAWAAGRLYFAGETLAEAVREFNRYSGRKLVVDDPQLGRLRIGGNFRATDPEGFVSALKDSFEIRADMSDPNVVRLIR